MVTKAEIVQLLKINDRAVGRALILLNDRQTADERVSETTKHHNGRGFNAAHAKRGTSMANFFKRTGFLTPKQLAWWRFETKGVSRIGLYANQLLEEAAAKEARRQAILDLGAAPDSRTPNPAA